MVKRSERDFLKDHLQGLGQAEVYAALRQLGFAGLAHPDRNVRAVAAMLVRTTTERRLEEFFREIGLIRSGGHATAARAVSIRIRDTMLRRLYRQMVPRPSVREAARWMIKRHSQWVRTKARKDAARGFANGDQFEVIFFEISRLGIRFPESEAQLTRIIRDLADYPEAPSDAQHSMVHNSP